MYSKFVTKTIYTCNLRSKVTKHSSHSCRSSSILILDISTLKQSQNGFYSVLFRNRGFYMNNKTFQYLSVMLNMAIKHYISVHLKQSVLNNGVIYAASFSCLCLVHPNDLFILTKCIAEFPRV